MQSRYAKSPVLGSYGTSRAVANLRLSIKNGILPIETRVAQGAERLDTIAGEVYGDGRYWWILAAASDIGWGMQIAPGTIINVPDLSGVLRLVA